MKSRISHLIPLTVRPLVASALVTGLTSTALLVPSVRATVINVDTTVDENNDDGDCSLREAIIAANEDSARSGCPAGNGADRIEVPAGTYVLTLGGAAEDASLNGDLDISSDVTIVGEGQAETQIDGFGKNRVLHVLSGNVTLSRLTIANGDAGTGIGGGLLTFSDVTIENSRIRDNAADTGGGIYVLNGTLTLIGTRVDGNTAQDAGGILTSTTVHVVDSVISGNTATVGNGGGIFNSGITSLSNSTVSGNSAANDGGGILTIGLETAQVIMFSATVANNTADSDADGGGDGGGIYAFPLGTINARNSLFGNNRDLSGSGDVFPDCSGLLFGVGYNLIENTDGCTLGGALAGYVTGLDPNLGPLHGNGGGTLTRALLAGSPAIDAGNPLRCIGPNGVTLDTDQRGFARNGRCDIGAFEFDSPGTPTPTKTATRTATATATRTATATGTRTATLRATVTGSRTIARPETPTHTATTTGTRTTPPRTRTPTVTVTRQSTSTATASPTSDVIETATATTVPTIPVTPSANASPSATQTVNAASPTPSATIEMVTSTHTATIAASPTPTATPIPTAKPECAGDCDGDATVRVDELLRGVNIALNTLPVTMCPAFDADHNAAVQVAEIIAGVNAALLGCDRPE